MAYVNFLKKIEDFEDLNEEDLRIIQSCCGEIKKYKHDQKIFSEGENAEHIWIVYEGEVGLRFGLPEHLNLCHDSYALLTGKETTPGIKKKKTTPKDNTISTLSEGMTFGWGSFVPPYTYSLSAYCDSISCNIMQLKKDQLLKTFDENPRIGYIFMANIARVIGTRFHKLQEEVVKRKGWEIMFRW